MDVKIKKMNISQLIEVTLAKGEEFFCEPGAIISIEGEAEIQSNMQGGLVNGAMRMLGGGESAFINTIRGVSEKSVVLIGTVVPSEIVEIELNGTLLLGDGAYLAHSGGVKISATWGGFDSLIAGSGLLFLKASGKGKLYVAGGESVIVKELAAGEVLYLDNSSFLAVPEGTAMEKKIVGKGLVTKVFGGEGFMFRITGPARVWYQTESSRGLAQYVAGLVGRK